MIDHDASAKNRLVKATWAFFDPILEKRTRVNKWHTIFPVEFYFRAYSTPSEGYCVDVATVLVEQGMQGCGYFTKFMQALEVSCRKNGVKRLRVENVMHKRLQEHFEKRGFKRNRVHSEWEPVTFDLKLTPEPGKMLQYGDRVTLILSGARATVQKWADWNSTYQLKVDPDKNGRQFLYKRPYDIREGWADE